MTDRQILVLFHGYYRQLVYDENSKSEYDGLEEMFGMLSKIKLDELKNS